MSDIPPLPTEFNHKLLIESPSMQYAAKAVTRNILFAVKIPYPLLKAWHKYLEDKKKLSVSFFDGPSDYVDLLEMSIPGHAFCISNDKEVRAEINKNLGIIAGSIKGQYTNSRGSRKRKQLDERVRSFHLFEGQVADVTQMKEEIKFLNNELNEWKRNYKDLEEEVEKLLEEIRNVSDEKSKTEKINEELAKYIEVLEMSSNEFSYKGKDISEAKNKSRTLNAFMDRAKVALWFAKSFGIELESITVKETKTGKNHVVSPMSGSESKNDGNQTKKINLVSEDERKKIEKILFLTDKFAVGDSFYHELSVDNGHLPRSYLIKQRRDQLNDLCNISATPGNTEGAQLPFVELLRERVLAFLESNQDFKGSEKPLRIKISGDGARMTRNSSFILLSFAILQEGEDVLAAKGNTTIAVVKGSESYKTIKEAFSDVFKNINELVKVKKLSLNEKDNIGLEFFLGGDYKFILLMLGLKSATSNYACSWCLVHKDNRWDMEHDLKYYNESPMHRTLKDIKDNAAKKKDNYCCENEPLLDIDLTHIVLDELHLLLRIMDVLIKNLILDVKEWDLREDPKKKRGEPKTVHKDKLVQTIRSCGVTFDIWEKTDGNGKSIGEYDFTSLLGSDKKKILNELPEKLTGEVIHLNTCDKVVKIWNSFKDLYSIITNKKPSTDEISQFFDNAKKWISMFTSLRDRRRGYRRANVTPYMHAMVFHVPFFMDKYGGIKMFSGQGVEKNNDVARNTVLRKSSKWNAPADVLMLEQRQWHLREHERSKRKYELKNTQYWEKELREKRRNKRKQ
jgi:hypothetical protein